jgi:signal transduction histidine kinase
MRLSTKFLLFNFLAKGIILLLFLAASPFVLRFFALKYTDRQLTEKKAEVLSIIDTEGIESFISEENPELGFGSYNILKEEYILIEQLLGPFTSDLIFEEERILDDVSVTYRVYSYSFDIAGEYYLMEIGRSLETISEIEHIIFKILIGTVLLFFALSFFLDNTFNKRILMPFSQIIDKKLSLIKEPQQFSYKPIATNTEEFVLLDESLSEMMRRIQRAFNQERIFISHASHELKTPISVLQTKVESMFSLEDLNDEQMEKLMDMQQTIQKMKKTVNALLLISKVNNAQFIKTEEVPLHEVLAELVEDWEAMAVEKNITLNFLGAESFILKDSNRSLCLMLFRNALINAIKYTPENGEIIVEGKYNGKQYTASIRDNGPGIPESLLNQVEEGTVFLKDVDKDKSGFGLQILHKVALYLGVFVDIKSNPASGTVVSFYFTG